MIDGAWDIEGIENVVKNDNMTLKGAIATHYHWDHIGGPVRGSQHVVPGIREFAAKGLPVRVPRWVPLCLLVLSSP